MIMIICIGGGLFLLLLFVATRRRRRRVINVDKKKRAYLLDARCVRAGLRNLMSKLRGPIKTCVRWSTEREIPWLILSHIFHASPLRLYA